MTPAKLALAIQAAYVRWHKQGRLDMRFHGPPPLDDEPDETEQFAADVLSYLPLLVKEGEPTDDRIPIDVDLLREACINSGYAIQVVAGNIDERPSFDTLAAEYARLASESSTAEGAE